MGDGVTHHHHDRAERGEDDGVTAAKLVGKDAGRDIHHGRRHPGQCEDRHGGGVRSGDLPEPDDNKRFLKTEIRQEVMDVKQADIADHGTGGRTNGFQKNKADHASARFNLRLQQRPGLIV